MARAIAEHVDALTDSRLWFDNPLAMRDARREFRGNRVFNAIVTLCVAVLLFAGFGSWAIYNLNRSEGGVPAWMGGDLGAALAIIVSGLHLWWIARASQSRVDGMLMREAMLDGMTSLLMLPVPRIRLVLQAAVYPCLSALTVAVLLLPVYICCVGVGGLTWSELFGLYTLFALASTMLPAFRRPALSGSIAAAMLNHAEEDPGSDASVGMVGRRRMIKPSFGMLTLAGFIPVLYVIISIVLGMGRTQIYGSLQRYVPEDILVLVPSSVISAPLMAARILISPFGFFDFTVTPCLFVVALALARKYLHVVRTSEYLSVGTYRDLAELPTYQSRRSAELILNMVTLLVATGFIWPWAVRDNGLAWLAANPLAPTAGFSGFVFALLSCGCGWALFRSGQLGQWMAVLSGDQEGRTSKSFSFKSSAIYLCLPFLVAGAVVLAATLLAGDGDLLGALLPMTGRMLAVTLSGMALNFGLRQLTGQYGLLGIGATALALWGPAAVRSLIYLSPMLGIISQGPRNVMGISSAGAPLNGAMGWTYWVLVMGAVGLMLSGAAWLMARFRHSATTAGSICLDPTLLGPEVFSDEAAARRSVGGAIDSPLSLAIVRLFQSLFDNAVLTRDLRSKLRSKITAGKVIGLFVLLLIGSAAIVQFAPMFTMVGASYTEATFHFGYQNIQAYPIVNLQGCFFLALPFAAFIGGYSVLPRAFGLDKRKNSLSFLLNTPMSAGAIVFGRAVAVLLTGGFAVWAITLWTLLMTIPVFITTGTPAAFTSWLSLASTSVVGYLAMGLTMLAMGTLFPDLTAIRLNGCLRIIVLFGVYMAISIISSIVMLIAQFYHFGDQARWITEFAATIAVAAAAFMIAVGAVAGMRKGDIDLKLAKR